MFKPTRPLALFSLVAAVLALTGCAAPKTVPTEVVSQGAWPADRQPATYAFAATSPQSRKAGRTQAALQNAAKGALEKAGFKPAADATSADVLVTLGSVRTASDPSPRALHRDAALWTRWQGDLLQTSWPDASRSLRQDPFLTDQRHDRAVIVLLRDRASGEALYKASALNTGLVRTAPSTAQLFDVALAEFPKANPKGASVPTPVAD
ncbi:hypothetical protein [Roseateles sp. LYH14W]|uniref:DUF4136 domain-containing protein n=1 Tax=Pelomonas parva TaxID=3299032 RepID=A0ABW7FB17_9BURK